MLESIKIQNVNSGISTTDQNMDKNYFGASNYASCYQRSRKGYNCLVYNIYLFSSVSE